MVEQAASDSLQQAAIKFSQYDFSWFELSSDIVNYIAVAIGCFIIFVSYFFGGGKRNLLLFWRRKKEQSQNYYEHVSRCNYRIADHAAAFKNFRRSKPCLDGIFYFR